MIITFSGARRGVNLSWVLRKDRAEREGVKKCMVDKAALPCFPPAPPPGRSFRRLRLSSCGLPVGKSQAVSLVKLCGFGGLYPGSEGETFSACLCQNISSVSVQLTGCVYSSRKNAPSDTFKAQFSNCQHCPSLGST